MSGQSALTDLRILPIEDFNFTVRLYNCLKRDGVHTLGDVLERSEQDLAQIPGLTMREVDEVRDVLGLINRTCGTDLHLKSNAPQPDFLSHTE